MTSALDLTSEAKCGTTVMGRRRLAGNYPRVFMQQADIWSDIAESIKDYRDDMRDRFDPMLCNHSFLRNAARLAERQARSIDTRPGVYMPRIHIRILEKHGTISGRFHSLRPMSDHGIGMSAPKTWT